MASLLQLLRTIFIFFILYLPSYANTACGARNLFSLYQTPPMLLNYHNGELLEGNLHISLLWYGKFSPAQKSIVVDLLLSLNSSQKNTSSNQLTFVSYWWKIVRSYKKKAGKIEINIILAHQFVDENCSLGKSFKKSHIKFLTYRVNSEIGGLTLILTSQDVSVEGFCMSGCEYHGWGEQKGTRKSVFIGIGNSVTQCPGQCAWPFHQPIWPTNQAIGRV